MHHHQLTCIIVRSDTAAMMLLVATFLAASTVHASPPTPSPNSYTLALHKALMFFNTQHGKLSDHNHVSWRGDSCLTDGKPSPPVL
ncbi:endoglucanase 9-like [Prunus yedoensis var. nudiflora]|uniref:cellulase n=1 Tax=Prunus yedoensis var. nudiflora TaxID=2094558 RepID=A0A314V314_PRUYE|nr:endoglucanase 9-like [Prunus yedoensis var. nudiflora]